jgi:hypothetical protein
VKFQCDCGAFTADTGEGWKSSPGRLVCYCDDCQEFAQQIGRADVLDEFGGSEIIPVYPNQITITSGVDKLCHTALSNKGPIRISTTCCNSPILNTRANFPWAGVFNTAFVSADSNALEKFGNIKARIMGKFAKPSAPYKISEKISLRDMLVVMPFIVKGKITGKHKGSAFFEEDGETPVSTPRA